MKMDITPPEPKRVTDINAATSNVETMVYSFIDRWLPWPNFDLGVEVMDVGQLRDAMGLRATIDIGDPWPQAEQILLQQGFVWHWLNGQRVMYLKEKEEYEEKTGWTEAEEVADGPTLSPPPPRGGRDYKDKRE